MLPRTWMLVAATLLLAGLAGCVPASLSDDVPDAVVLNAPYPERVPGAAEALLERLEGRDTGLEVVDSARARFLESRSGLVGQRASAEAGDLAGSIGADVAVGVSAARLERELRDGDGTPREHAVLRLQVFVVTRDGEVWDRFESSTYRGNRFLDEAELPPLDADRLVASLRDDALAELEPQVRTSLRSLNASLTGERVDVGIGGDEAEESEETEEGQSK